MIPDVSRLNGFQFVLILSSPMWAGVNVPDVIVDYFPPRCMSPDLSRPVVMNEPLLRWAYASPGRIHLTFTSFV